MFNTTQAADKSFSISPKELERLSQEQLYLLFTQERWGELDNASRLAALQEIENRQALIDGRLPIKIMIGNKKDFTDPGLMGTHNNQTHIICLNYRFFDNVKTHTSAEALSTVLHEGRHEYQQLMVEKGLTIDSPQILKEWLSSEAFYVPPELDHIVYAMQSIEDDARRFERRELRRIIDIMLLRDTPDQSFINAYKACLQEEAYNIDLIREHLTMDIIDMLEESLADLMAQAFPELGIHDITFFDNARLILQADINSNDDLVRLLEELDNMADEKLNMIKEKKLDQINDSI